jgi:hypothetical protein
LVAATTSSKLLVPLHLAGQKKGPATGFPSGRADEVSVFQRARMLLGHDACLVR